MSTVEQSGPTHRIRAVAVRCLRVTIGPFSDRSRLDRIATGAAGGVLLLAAIALPVTVATITTSKTVPLWVTVPCLVAGIVGLILVIKSCQRPRVRRETVHSDLPEQGHAFDGQQTGESWTRRDPILFSGETEFIGRSADVDSLLGALRDPNISLITIKGMGGIGKTALAREGIRRVAMENVFAWNVWVSTQAERFLEENGEQHEVADYSFEALLADILAQSGRSASAGSPPSARCEAVKDMLADTPILITLDNLETVRNRDIIVAKLYEIRGRATVLVTSRYALESLRKFTIELNGLSVEDSIEFLETTARSHNNQNLLRSSRSGLTRIYKVTGGAPLAMLLVSGQMYYQPVDRVLSSIEKAGTDEISYKFYSFIFRRSWDDLNASCRKLLIAMRHFEGSPETDALKCTADMSEDEFYTAATTLVQRSLLNVRVTTHEARYSLHPLTRYFVNTDIADKWK